MCSTRVAVRNSPGIAISPEGWHPLRPLLDAVFSSKDAISAIQVSANRNSGRYWGRFCDGLLA